MVIVLSVMCHAVPLLVQLFASLECEEISVVFLEQQVRMALRNETQADS